MKSNKLNEYKKPELRNGEVVTPLGTFSEAVVKRERWLKIWLLIIILGTISSLLGIMIGLNL